MVFQQAIGIPMGTDLTPDSFEFGCMKCLIHTVISVAMKLKPPNQPMVFLGS